MAATVTVVERIDLGNKNATICTFAWDATYPAGGESATANQFGLSTLSAVIPVSSTTAGFVYNWDQTNLKMQAFYADYSTTTDGPLIDIAVGDTAALTGIVTTVLAIGV